MATHHRREDLKRALPHVPTYEDLVRQNETLRMAGGKPDHSKTGLLVTGITALCVLEVGFIVAITAIRPDADNMPLIVMASSVVGPVITALLAIAVKGVHVAVNGRLSQLLELTAKASAAEGVIAGIDKQKAEGGGTPSSPPLPQ